MDCPPIPRILAKSSMSRQSHKSVWEERETPANHLFVASSCHLSLNEAKDQLGLVDPRWGGRGFYSAENSSEAASTSQTVAVATVNWTRNLHFAIRWSYLNKWHSNCKEVEIKPCGWVSTCQIVKMKAMLARRCKFQGKAGREGLRGMSVGAAPQNENKFMSWILDRNVRKKWVVDRLTAVIIRVHHAMPFFAGVEASRFKRVDIVGHEHEWRLGAWPHQTKELKFRQIGWREHDGQAPFQLPTAVKRQTLYVGFFNQVAADWD
ncbi:hypothetical protein V8B97DRAFT_1917318 [Scleroderma yunnanense]